MSKIKINGTTLDNILSNAVNEKLEKNKNYFLSTRKKTNTIHFLPNINIHHLYVKCGKIVEKSLIDVAKASNFQIEPLENINTKNIKGKATNRKVDLIISNKNTVYCFEMKNNLNLDAGKTRDTISTMKITVNRMVVKYPNKDVYGILVGNLNTTEEALEFNSSKSFIDNNLGAIGYDDFFGILNVNITKIDYEKSLQKMGNLVCKHAGLSASIIKSFKNVMKTWSANIKEKTLTSSNVGRNKTTSFLKNISLN